QHLHEPGPVPALRDHLPGAARPRGPAQAGTDHPRQVRVPEARCARSPRSLAAARRAGVLRGGGRGARQRRGRAGARARGRDRRRPRPRGARARAGTRAARLHHRAGDARVDRPAGGAPGGRMSGVDREEGVAEGPERAGKATRGLAWEEPLLFESSRPGRRGCTLPALDVPDADPADALPADWLRDDLPGLPELSEVEVVRHFTRLSTWNAAVDLGLYPLGSCTMKYNPKINEAVARLPGFAAAHPLQPAALSQGFLELCWRLERALAEISGMDRVTLQPAAGAQGELAGIMMIRAYHEQRGEKRSVVLVPDSAHGTNPAS